MYSFARRVLNTEDPGDEAANVTALRDIAIFEPKARHEFVNNLCLIFSRVIPFKWRSRGVAIAWQGRYNDVDWQLFRGEL